jgi:hypothetical protein
MPTQPPSYALRHLSIRVPWHDNGWDGRVCQNPAGNMACLVLKGIGSKRNDTQEMKHRGESLEVIPDAERPCCINERGFFMAPFEFTRTKKHPYTETSPDSHGHFRETILRHPAYSADAVPFRWMQKPDRWMDARQKNKPDFRDVYQLDLDPEREPELDFDKGWFQERNNHAALLDCFIGHIRPHESLCFFYAKRTPLSEDSRRVIVGVGTVKHIAESREYRYAMPEEDAPLRSLLWERLVQHSIRPDGEGGFTDGFLLPYHQAVSLAERDSEFDPASVVAFAPDDRRSEFSYVSEHVTHDGAIGGLLACAAALREAAKHLEGPWDRYLKWIDGELGRLWKLRGPCPGLGAALTAFGIELGVFVAYDLAKRVGENEDPWPVVDRMFKEPRAILSTGAKLIGKEHQAVWKSLSPDRRALLKLLSRFEITPDQAKLAYVEEDRAEAKIECTDAELLANPYRLFEITRMTAQPISIATVDRGLFPESLIRDKHPLPEPSLVTTGTDVRRIRAWTIQTLEDAAADGDTLLPRSEVITAIREMDHRPECPVTGDLMTVAEKTFAPELEIVALADKKPAFQLARLAQCSKLIRGEITKRLNGKPHVVVADWLKLLADSRVLGPVNESDKREISARTEKAAALKVVAEGRVSVLIGPAGTGKTTLLAVLCGHEAIANGGILLLAPTGKARVRMEQAAKTKELSLTGQTIAGYLLESGRYVPDTGQYRLLGPSAPKGRIVDTVIIDEASMMTEEMLGAVLEAVGGTKRIILVGDHRQLPPIGAGRPFTDIVAHLQPDRIEALFPKVAKGYAELTLNWRQGPSAPDTRLAAWFANSDPGPGEEGIFADLASFGPNDRIQVHSWNTAEECHELVIKVLQTELKLSGPNDILGFGMKLGGTESKGHCYFNRTWDKGGVGEAAEAWQILSPVRPLPHGVTGLNRLIHKLLRSATVERARERYRKTPKPLGPEEIVYGDKVISVRNQRRWWEVYPDEGCAKYVANGEIGIAVGQFKGPQAKYKGLPWKLEVEFTSQPRFTYGYTGRDFGEEGEPSLELAYALTVHKAQGSEFGTVILVLPNPCRLLSRELLYTALTRQRNRVVILFQGNPVELRNYSRSEHSETARRLTNLFREPEPVVVNERRYDGKHIHRTARGELVMSKSEVIIANELHRRGIDYAYEKELCFGKGRICKPDFTIEDAASGLTVYWEHCGMLDDPEYLARWELKQKWYRDNGVLPDSEGGGPNGTLVVTSDAPQTGFDTLQIGQIVEKLFTGA